MEDLWERVRKVAGATPIAARPIEAGYTVASRWVVQLDNGTSVFVKAATDEDTAQWLRDEYLIYRTVHASFMPKLIGWEDAEFPLLVLQDLSMAAWSWTWSNERVGQVLRLLDRMARMSVPAEIPPLTEMAHDLSGWREIQRDPDGFLRLGLVSAAWLEQSLPTLIEAETRAPLEGDALVHADVRSDNICFLGNETYLVDWNWAHRGNPAFDVIAWLPSLHTEGGPAPWKITLGEPELIAAIAGFFAARAPKPPHKQGPAIRQMQLRQLKSALPWAVKALKLPSPVSRFDA